MTSNALVLLSGGIDSAAAAVFMQTAGHPVLGIFVDYGQPAASIERRSAEAVAGRLDMPLSVISVSLPTGVPPGEIPGRNGFFVLSALMSGLTREGLITLGIHAGTRYYDCTAGFICSVDRLVAEYSDGRLRAVAPFVGWSKKNVFDYFVSAGLSPDITYSCETGMIPPCGNCMSCRDRRILGC